MGLLDAPADAPFAPADRGRPLEQPALALGSGGCLAGVDSSLPVGGLGDLSNGGAFGYLVLWPFNPPRQDSCTPGSGGLTRCTYVGSRGGLLEISLNPFEFFNHLRPSLKTSVGPAI
jgi:hypothetical protein